MGEPVQISLGYRTNPGRHPHVSSAQLINCFAEQVGEDAKTSIVIYNTEGFINFGAALDGGGERSRIVVNGTLYVVVGRNVYAVTSAGASTLIGSVPTDGPVYMASNRKSPPQIGIVSDGLYFVIDTTANSMTEILDPDLPSPISISSLDGYGIIPTVNATYMLTGIDQFEVIDGLDEGTVEAYPDGIVRSMVLERELILFGDESIEWHQDTGNADFPFERVHSIEIGCLSGPSAALVDTPSRKTIIWVAPDHTVKLMSGYSAQVISTPEIETLIKDLHVAGDIGQLKGFGWAYEGRFFYVLTCDSWTRQYDSKTNNWATRKSYGISRWRVNDVVRFGEKLIGFDYANGQMYQMDMAFFDEAGSPKVCDVITPPVHAFPYPIKGRALYIDAATGVGKNTGSDYIDDPKLLVSWSRDGGISYLAERERSLGRTAQYRRVQPIYRLGRASDKGFTFRFRLSAPVEQVMMQAALDFTRLKP